MPTYTVTAINVGSFLLGEADKVLTVFSSEKGIIRAVAKGARKPGTKMAGRSDVLSVNKLFLSTGKTFEIITQAETIESFPEFRQDLARLAYGLYYAELTHHFGQGLSEESEFYFDYVCNALRHLARTPVDPAWLCLEFELGLLDMLGYRPELTYCVNCRQILGDYNVAMFNQEHGGILCQSCSDKRRRYIAEARRSGPVEYSDEGIHITPLVWKNLVMALELRALNSPIAEAPKISKPALQGSVHAARRLVQHYLEHRAGKRMKALDLIEQIGAKS